MRGVLLPSIGEERSMVDRGGLLWHHKPIGPLNPSFTSKSENVKSWPSAMGGQKRDLTALDDSAKSGKTHSGLCNGPKTSLLLRDSLCDHLKSSPKYMPKFVIIAVL